jgi:hypothetical protein
MTNKIQLVDNRVEIAKSYLLSQFKDKPNINALVDVLVTELQEIENTIIELQEVRTLAGAKGWWLDRIGEELDTQRYGFSDADYKTILRIAMLKKTASATIEDIIKVLSYITNDDELRVDNPNKYLIEAVGYLFGVKDSMLTEVAELFPINTRKLIVQRDTTPFKLNTAGKGFGNGSLNSILLYDVGIATDPRFVPLPTEKYIPPVVNSPTVKTTPYIYGVGEVGQTLTYVNGEFNGVTPLTVTKQWQRDGVDIGGATSNTYVLVSGDAGKTITVKTTATNVDGTLVIYSNNVSVSSVIPPVDPLAANLGLYDINSDRFQLYDGTLATATHSITFEYNGSITLTDANGAVSSSAYLTDVGDHHGNAYAVRYTTLSGNDLIGLAPNVSHTLSTALTLSQSVTSKTTKATMGTYRFTIFKLSDITVTRSVDIYMSVTIERDL